MEFKRIRLDTADPGSFATRNTFYLRESVSQINEVKDSCSRIVEFCEALKEKYGKPDGHMDDNLSRILMPAIYNCYCSCDLANKVMDAGFAANADLLCMIGDKDLAADMETFASNIALVVEASRKALFLSFGDVCDFIPKEDENFKKKSVEILSGLMLPEMTNGRNTRLDSNHQGGHSCNLGGGSGK